MDLGILVLDGRRPPHFLVLGANSRHQDLDGSALYGFPARYVSSFHLHWENQDDYH